MNFVHFCQVNRGSETFRRRVEDRGVLKKRQQQVNYIAGDYANRKPGHIRIERMGHTLLCKLEFILFNLLYKQYSGVYQCCGHRKSSDSTKCSNRVSIHVSDRPRSRLTAGTTTVSVGDRVTLSCSVEKSAGWKYEWFRRTSHTSEYRINDGENGNIRVSQGGIYRCRGFRGEPAVYSDKSDEVTINITFSNKVSVTQKPSWSQMFRGETITLTCEVQGGEGVQWEYEWRRPQSQTFRTNRKDWTFTASISGDYSCKSRPTDDSYSGTKWSEAVRVSVSDKPRSRLTAGTTTVSVGDRVTLSCSVEKSAGWKYEWFRRTSHTSEYRINDGENGNIRVSQGGIYRCRGSRGEPAVYSDKSDEVTINITFSNKVSVTQKPSWSQMFRGETITLTCEVQGGEGVQWEYEWRTPQSQTFRTNRKDWTFTASISGDYSCKSRPTDDSYSATKWSEAARVSVSAHKPKAEMKITEFPAEGRVNLSCSVKPSSGWSFFWFRGEKLSKPLTIQEAVFLSNGQISVSQGGVYRCRGGRGEPVYHTEFSDPITVDEPVLRVSPRWLSPGSSVTLSCEVEHVSAGWSFYWYKAVPDLSHKSGSYSYELLPASSNGTADNSYIIHGQTHTAGYVCRAGRGEPHVYTLYSQPHFVWSGDLHPSASLSVSPDRVQHFTSDSLSLTCEGNSAEWRVGSFLLPDLLSFCSDWGTMTGSTCHVQKIQSSNAVFWCESGSAFSNAVNITGHNDDLILLSPVHPVTEGHSVTLGCKWRTENLLSKVFFYQNDTLIQSESRVEMIIPAVSKSHEGFYKCQSSGKESPQSWLAVTSSRPDSSSLHVLMIVGPVCVFLLMIFLLMFYLYRKSKDSSSISRSDEQNQNCDPDEIDAEHNTYASLLHGQPEFGLFTTIY
ncbi:Fc receptor-like protein 5 [Oryzias melastigma]|uniref:Fc receptor-like protein 5 n=1 Tax=Oryzias melastigma TaxID=30732 RepID=UPI00168D3F10|nr:Fc receptor-like protein 5 [Oryzias melastigma]